MKRLYKFIALVATLVITLTAGVIVHRLFFKSPVWLSTSSPNRTYTVELTGNKSRSFYHRVGFNLIKDGQPIIENAYAHSGDWMDISFELAYPEQAWINENVLKFWRNPDRPEQSGADALLILNETGKTIRYLKVNSKDMFLVFDLRSNSTLKLFPSHQSWLSWVDCEGEFEDGQRIQCNGVNFFHNDNLNPPLKYCVSVKYDRVVVESPQIGGYDVNSDLKIPNVPKATACRP